MKVIESTSTGRVPEIQARFRIFEPGTNRTELTTRCTAELFFPQKISDNYSEDSEYKIAVENFVPGSEVNPLMVGRRIKEVNIMLRFEEMFSRLVKERLRSEKDTAGKTEEPFWGYPAEENRTEDKEDLNSKERTLEGIEDPFLAYSAELDRLSGCDFRYFQEENRAKDIENGLYGERAAELFSELSPAERRVLLGYMIISDEQADYYECFEGILLSFFSDEFHSANLYYDKDGGRYILVSDMEKSDHNIKCAELIELLFCGINYRLDTVFGYTAGILGKPSTVHTGNIMLL